MGEDTRSAIMEATYRALCAHGYGALTMQDIADECDRSKSALHYHYDTKAELLTAFLDHLLADFESKVEASADLPPEERLAGFVDWFVFDRDDDERERFHLALLELRAQGAFTEQYRKQLRRSDDLLVEMVADIIDDGIESGAFEDVDPDETATLMVAALDGARTRQITLRDETYTDRVQDALIRRVIAPLLVDLTAEEFTALGAESTAFEQPDEDQLADSD